MHSQDKFFDMKSTYNIIGAVAVVLFMAACGAATEGDKKDLDKKKAQLEELKEKQTKTGEEITKLEKEIATLDTSAVRADKPKLVVLTTLNPSAFTHYIDLQGKVDAENIAWVTPRGQGGLVRAIYVKQGNYVRK